MLLTIQNMIRSVIKNVKFKPPLLIQITTSITKNFITMPFWLNQIDVLEVAYILNDLSNKVCLPNKTEGLNLSKFNMVTGINELKTLTNYISCEFKYRFDRKKCKSNQ